LKILHIKIFLTIIIIIILLIVFVNTLKKALMTQMPFEWTPVHSWHSKAWKSNQQQKGNSTFLFL